MKKRIKIIGCILSVLLCGWSCTKIAEGYISDHLFYQVNPLEVSQGVTTYSSPIVSNGSTTPLTVRLIRIKNEQGEDVTQEFTTPQHIVTYRDELTWQDSTLAQLEAKLQDSLVTPFNVNTTGGRLEFSAATSYLPLGRYFVDVEVSNIKGTRTIENACEIILQPVENAYSIAYKRISNDDGFSSTDDADIIVTVTHEPGTEGSWNIYKFIDKNGELFNPQAGEITRRSRTSPFMDNWNPYYPVQFTDTALVQQMPNTGLPFPYFTTFVVGGATWTDTNARFDWMIPSGFLEETSLPLYGLISFQFYTSGTYTITTQVKRYSKRH